MFPLTTTTAASDRVGGAGCGAGLSLFLIALFALTQEYIARHGTPIASDNSDNVPLPACNHDD